MHIYGNSRKDLVVPHLKDSVVSSFGHKGTCQKVKAVEC